MRFTTLFSIVALAAVQASVATAGAVAKGDEVGTKYEVCTTANASSCGTGSECVAAPNSFVPTLAVGVSGYQRFTGTQGSYLPSILIA